MKISQYIIVRKTGTKYSSKYSSRMTIGAPALASNEIAVKVSLDIPPEIFEKPALEAEIKVPKDAVSKPVISAEVIDNVEKIIKQNTGFEVKLELIEQEKND